MGSNTRPSDREPSALPLDHSFAIFNNIFYDEKVIRKILLIAKDKEEESSRAIISKIVSNFV